ncbi:condensation domain-containing protein, partial [Pseudomonas sp. MAFF 302030]
HEVVLAELPIQYADYAIWQRHWMEAGEQERQLGYWRQQLGDEQPVLELPLDRPRPAIQSHQGARLDLALDDELASGLRQLAQAQGVTLFMLLLASFQTLLSRYSGQSDIRVGVPIANRNRVETERLIGFFVNTQVLRAQVDGSMPFTALMQQVKDAALGAQEHQDLPFEQLVEALQPERSLSHSPLFQVMFNHQTAVRSATRPAANQSLSIEPLNWETQTTHFDLVLNTFEAQDGLWASLSYATDIFDSGTVEGLGRHWQTLLRAIVAQPGQFISELALLEPEEYRQITQEWNKNDADYPLDLCVHQLIEEQVRQRPEAVALVYAGQTLSYAQLNARANRLAH